MTVTSEKHTVKRYDAELEELEGIVREMGALVTQQIREAVKSLRHEDLDLAREVIERDHVVNGLDVRADAAAVDLIARRQPMGQDLRRVMSLHKTVADLERMGDEAEKVARMAVRIYSGSGGRPGKKLLRDVKSMSKLALGMLEEALGALENSDVERAVGVVHGDSDLDNEFQSTLRALVTYIMEDSRNFGYAIDVVFAVKALERIGDHAKNIAEYVVFLVMGKDVRHTSPEEIESSVEELDTAD